MASKWKEVVVRVGARVGVTFRDPGHIAAQLQDAPKRERLELLGDRLISATTMEVLYDTYSHLTGNNLGAMLPKYVSNDVLTLHSKRLGLTEMDFFKRRKAEKHDADLLEMLVGAIVVDSGHRPAADFTRKHLLQLDHSLVRDTVRSAEPKRHLRVLMGRELAQSPKYVLIGAPQPKRKEGRFMAAVYTTDDQMLGKGCGNSIKGAEQEAAQDALCGYFCSPHHILSKTWVRGENSQPITDQQL